MSARRPDDLSRLPAYLTVARTLHARLRSSGYLAGEYLPPERDLAREFGVSRQTIRRAVQELSGQGLLIAEQGRGTRIVALPLQPNPDDAQFQLAALVIYGIDRSSSGAICRGCQDVMKQAGFHIILAETAVEEARRADDEAAQIGSLIERGINGLIVYVEATARNRDLLQSAVDRGIPVVQIDRYIPGLACDYVGVDNAAAARTVTQHLWDMGHRRIAFLTQGNAPSSVTERGSGYAAAIAERTGGAPDPDLVYTTGRTVGGEDDALVALRTLLSLPDPATAIFAINDDIALAVLRAARKLNVRIPDDIALVGFDDLPFCEIISPTLSTVAQPFVESGQAAAHFLLDRITSRYRGLPRHMMMPTRLVVRESSVGAIGGSHGTDSTTGGLTSLSR